MINHVLEVRKNIFYTKDKQNNFIRGHEIVLVVDEPKYSRTNEGDVVRERSCKELRFTISTDEKFDLFIEILQKYRDSKEEDLT